MEWWVSRVKFQTLSSYITLTLAMFEAGDVQASFVQAVVTQWKHAFYKSIYRAVTGWCLL